MNKMRQYLRLVKLYFHYSRLASAQQLYPVIFKCDDLARITKSVKILDFLTKLFCVKLSWGIIGKSLQNPSTRYVAWLKKRYASGRYHFFNHGYFHLCEKEYEFDQKPLSYQTAMLRNTQTLDKKHLNITINTFGAPANHIDQNTAVALSSFPEIKYWYYGRNPNTQTPIVLPRLIDVEQSVGIIDFAFFKAAWQAHPKQKGEIITLQMHPNMWHHVHFLHFCTVIAFLRSEGAYFITPNDLLKQDTL